MHKTFLIDNYKPDVYLKVTSLAQGCMSVEEYTREFEQLKIRSGLEEELKHTMARFLRGLDLSVVEKVELQPYWTLKDMCKLAIKVDKHF